MRGPMGAEIVFNAARRNTKGGKEKEKEEEEEEEEEEKETIWGWAPGLSANRITMAYGSDVPLNAPATFCVM
eukprot:scaffold4442_cov125-Amphora_coffeaeformis.AAC.30